MKQNLTAQNSTAQDLANKVALVTGSASGLGKQIAELYAKSGAKVGIADINLEAAQTTADEITQKYKTNGGAAIALAMDVTSEEAVNEGVQKLVDTFGTVDILVSNAGIQIINRIEEMAFDSWKKMLAIHLDGAFLTTKACLKHMYKNGNQGTVIYMGSVHSHEASPFKAPYVTAKHGLLGLCRVLAKEGAEHNVRSHVICPGFVKTPLVDKQIPEQAAEKGITEEQVISDIMLKNTVDNEFTTVEDIAQLSLFLAAFPTNVFTGQSIVASHGWFMN